MTEGVSGKSKEIACGTLLFALVLECAFTQTLNCISSFNDGIGPELVVRHLVALSTLISIVVRAHDVQPKILNILEYTIFKNICDLG